MGHGTSEDEGHLLMQLDFYIFCKDYCRGCVHVQAAYHISHLNDKKTCVNGEIKFSCIYVFTVHLSGRRLLGAYIYCPFRVQFNSVAINY